VFTWYNAATGGTSFNTGSSYTTPALTDTISYFVESQIAATGCGSVGREEVIVTVNPLPNAFVAPSQTVCDGSSVSLGAASTSGNTYNWTSNPTGFTSTNSDPSVTPNDTTTYTLVETISATGCTTSNSVTINVTTLGQWIGVVSTAWDNAANWCGGIPNASTDVVIASGAPFYPIIVTPVTAVTRDLSIVGTGTVTLASGDLKVHGDVSTYLAGFTQTGGMLTFQGGGNPQFTSALNVKDVTVQNGPGLTLLGNFTVSGTLNFGAGDVHTGVYEVNVTNKALAAISNYGQSRFVDGKLRRSMDTTGVYAFPVGVGNNYELVELTLHNLQGVDNVLTFFNPTIAGTTPNLTVNGTLINTLLNGGIWTLTPNAQPTSGTYDLNLHQRGHNNGGVSQQAYTVIKRANAASPWVHEGVTVGNSQIGLNGTVSVPNYSLASFSEFGIGFGNTVLPVTLTSFDATVVNDDEVLLDWKTESEYNNDYFEVERSADGVDFTSIGKVLGNGTTTSAHTYQLVDRTPVTGVNYYRLRQVDFDGTEHYSQVRAVEIIRVATVTVGLYPVPAVDVLNVTNVETGSLLSVYDLTGKKLVEVNAEAMNAMLDLNRLAPGTYLLKIENAKGVTSQTFSKQ
jgi:hypothetical protein